MPRPKFRRRNFFIKKNYQSRFALYPILFLLLFLFGAGGYLYWYLKGFLEFQLYLPHSHLDNPWHEISPELTRVAVWGGGAFLFLLCVWVWRRFGALRRDLNRIADWMAAHARGSQPDSVPHFRDPEVERLCVGLAAAVERFATWDAAVEGGCERLRALGRQLEAMDPAATQDVAEGLAAVEAELDAVDRCVAQVRVNESLS